VADLPFPPAPMSSDNETVILWVVTVLVLVLAIVVFALWRLMERNQAECREENKRAWLMADTKQGEIVTLLTTLVSDSNVILRRTNEVIDTNNHLLAGLESGRYRAREH